MYRIGCIVEKNWTDHIHVMYVACTHLFIHNQCKKRCLHTSALNLIITRNRLDNGGKEGTMQEGHVNSFACWEMLLLNRIVCICGAKGFIINVMTIDKRRQNWKKLCYSDIFYKIAYFFPFLNFALCVRENWTNYVFYSITFTIIFEFYHNYAEWFSLSLIFSF